MNLHLLIFIILFDFSKAKYFKFNISTHNANHINDCVNTIIKRSVFPESLIYLINTYLKISFPVVYQNSKKFQSFETRKADMYIISFQRNLLQILKFLLEFENYNSRAKFLILTDSLDKQIFKIFTKYFIYKVVVLETKTGNLLTFDPYIYEDISASNIKPKMLGNCESNFKKENLFKAKLPVLWRNTTVQTIFYEFFPYLFIKEEKIKGGEYIFHELLIEKTGFKTDHIVLKNNVVTEFVKHNGSFKGIMSRFSI